MKILFPHTAWMRLLVMGLVATLLSACATTEARIRRNQAAFDRLTPEQQQFVREGKIALGFTPEMVELAVGSPDQRWVRTDASGQTEIWSYTRYTATDGSPFYTGFYHRYYRSNYALFYGESSLATARPTEYFRVEFREGKVAVVQQEQR